MLTTTADLSQFKLDGRIGEGADSEVFAATDSATGDAVVVKRPHPMLIVRGQHNAVERRMASAIALREQLGDTLPCVAKLIGYSQTASHDDYFSDMLGEPYSVVVEERARGIPLVASAMDGIKRHPIGLPQNLFAIHPVLPHLERGRFSILRDLLEVGRAFDNAGALILDMRPQNIYFHPGSATITVIDIGGVTEPQAASSRKPPLDLHDLYLELLRWYIPHTTPPPQATGYAQPIGMETIPMFNQNLDTMVRQHTDAPDGDWHDAVIDILHKVKARVYPGLDAFAADSEALLDLLNAHYERLSHCEGVRNAWQEAAGLLTANYWRKYQFDADSLREYSG